MAAMLARRAWGTPSGLAPRRLKLLGSLPFHARVSFSAPDTMPCPPCDLLTSLRRAEHAMSAGADAADELTEAYTRALDLYVRLDPSRTRIGAHLQGLLESCIQRIDLASRTADAGAVAAALQLLLPLQSMLPRLSA